MSKVSQREFGQLFQSYLVNLLLFGIALFVYRTSMYYTEFLSAQTQKALVMVVVAYAILAIPMEMALPRSARRIEGKGFIALRAISRFLRDWWRYLRSFPLDRSLPPRISKEEKVAILFLLVKFYYLPIMLNFLFGNWSSMVYNWNSFNPMADIHHFFLVTAFPFISATFFFVDTLYFTFGYAVEYPLFRHKVRSVEPTLLGWMVALLCYPPFNRVMDTFFLWVPDDSAFVDGALFFTYAIRITSLALLWIYLWATLALGPRSSNLTNRGIVSWGPYAYVRHPAYAAKTLAWWTLGIPFFIHTEHFLLGIFSLGGWAVVYFLRALTEERHLIADPDYQEYCKKVCWRFIPFVF